MTRYWSSDLHLGHKNITAFCNRPFITDGYVDGKPANIPDVNRMNTTIIDRINSVVTPEDELWLLGDLAMGDVSVTVPMLERIICPIVIVTGNHDKIHPYMGKEDRYADLYYSLRNVVEIHNDVRDLTVEIAGETVLVNHFPYFGNSWEAVNGRQDKYEEYRPAETGGWLLCGHVHDSWLQQGRQINVGLDAWAGFPVHENDIARMIENGPADLPVRRWV